ncbi:unnamed protein product [Auanema sp. JU1783]|nr:unnamed protein product [Auanema sp. JU1783]
MSSSRQSLESLEMFRSPLGQSLDRISVSSAEKRTRWASKLEEIETKLGETELINSDLNQMRAELNRKIIELEKAQKPLIDENRKLQGRNKNLQQEIKKLEQQLSHAKDDFYTMKDAHERIRKENFTLKGKRTNAEKLEQLDRYRQQILEYSKCITALRTSGLAKDRRYELLVSKYKRLRTCCRSGDHESDNRSTNGSECSLDDIIISNTIHENFEQQSHQPIPCEGQSFKMLGREEENVYIARVKLLESQIDELREEIAASRDHNELLEFQVLEMEETTNPTLAQLIEKIRRMKKKSRLSSEELLILNQIEKFFDGVIRSCGCSVNIESENEKDEKLLSLKNSCLALEKTLASSEEQKTCLEKLTDELKLEKTELEKKLTEEKFKTDETQKKAEKSNEELLGLKQIIDKITKENNELCDKNKKLEKDIEDLKEQIRPIKTELERRYEETKYKLSIALEKVHEYENMESVKPEVTQNVQDLRELEEYNTHLENQVTAQTEIIDLLKDKLKEQNYVSELIARFKEEGKTLSDCVHIFQEMENKKNGIMQA